MENKEELISLMEFAKLNGIKPITARERASKGFYKTARKIGRDWVIDKNEPYIRLTDYARMQGISRNTALERANRGSYKTAVQIGRVWVIDKNEPHQDNRINSGQYIGYRKKIQAGINPHTKKE